MLENDEVNDPMLFLGEEFLYHCKQEESLQLRWEFTCDTRQSAHLDFISMHGGFIPTEAVSDIAFLSETNKQYAELGLIDRPVRSGKLETDLNNNKKKRISTKMDVDFPTDCSKGETNEGFEIFFDRAIGETKVKLGSYEYIIDTSSHFAETEINHHNMDSKFTQAGVIATTKQMDVLPATESDLENYMFNDDKDQDFSSYSHEAWDSEERDLGSMDFVTTQHTMIIPEFSRKSYEITTMCVQASLRKEDDQRNQSEPAVKVQSHTSLNWSMKPEFQSPTTPLDVLADDNRKTLPSFATFNKSIESDPCRSNNKLNRSPRERRWKDCEQSKSLYHLNPDYTKNDFNVPDLLSYPEQCLNTHLNGFSNQHQTPADNLSNKRLEIETKAFNNIFCASSDTINECSPTIRHNQICTQTDRMNQNTLQPTFCSTDLSTHLLDFNQYRQTNEICSGMEGAKPQVLDVQLNERLFETTEPKPKKKWKRGCRLWEYIRNLLLEPRTNPVLIKWVDRSEGTFKLVQNKAIAHMWGMKKGNGEMSYEKLSRAMRYYYKKQIFQPVIGKRLVYKFGPLATGWKENT